MDDDVFSLVSYGDIAVVLAGLGTGVYLLSPEFPTTGTGLLIILFMWVVILIYLDLAD